MLNGNEVYGRGCKGDGLIKKGEDAKVIMS